MKWRVVSVVVAVVAGGIAVDAAPSAAAPPIVVTTTADVIDAGDGVLSLREAVAKANADAGEDTIQLASDATYELTICTGVENSFEANNVLGDLDATDPAGLGIVGGGSTVRQTCTGHRVLQSGGQGITPSPSLTAEQVAFDQGFGDFGGLVSYGSIELDHVSVTNVTGIGPATSSPYTAAVAGLGAIRITHSMVADNKDIGGVSGGFPVVIEDSVVARNGASGLRAGGVWGDDDVEITRSRIEENVAADVTLEPSKWGASGGVGGYGSITVTDSEIVGNTGFTGGVGPGGGPIVVTRSLVRGNHGAIGGGLRGYALDVSESTIEGNDAGFGAGIAGSGSISDSTISNNTAVGIPSAGTTGGGGGGLFLQNDTVVTRSTITGNSAVTASGLLVDFGGADYEVTVSDSTVSVNPLVPAPPDPIALPRAEIWHGQNTTNGELRFERSVVGTSGTRSCSGGGIPVTSSGYTFWADDSCAAPLAWGDVVAGGDPALGPLQDDGGPTETRLPLPGSPVKDRIPLDDPGCSGEDQRGVPRPQGLGCDIGATELDVPPSGFVGMTPTRILDTRSTPRPPGWPAGAKLSAPGWLELTVAGANGVPADATAVVLNVTSTEATTAAAYVAAWPVGQLPPPTSVLNLQPGANVANSMTVAPGVGGKVALFTNTGATHLVVDVMGYYVPLGGAGFTSTDPTRVLDTRTGPVPAGRPVGQKLSGPGTIRLPVAGVGAVPSDATSVVVNITTTQATSPLAYVTAWPAGQLRPGSSNLNLQPLYNVANLAIVKVGTGGAIDLYTNIGSTHLIVDVVGYFQATSGDRFLPLNPARVFDSRDTTPLTNTIRHAQVAGLLGIPGDATAVVLNATSAAATSSGGFLTVFAKGQPVPVPLTSNLNYRPPYNAPNQVMARVGQDQSVSMVNGAGTVEIVLDANGYFVAV